MTASTLKVRQEGYDYVRTISAESYNPEIHEIVGAKKEKPADSDREKLKAALDAANVQYAKNAGDAKLLELVNASEDAKSMFELLKAE